MLDDGIIGTEKAKKSQEAEKKLKFMQKIFLFFLK